MYSYKWSLLTVVELSIVTNNAYVYLKVVLASIYTERQPQLRCKHIVYKVTLVAIDFPCEIYPIFYEHHYNYDDKVPLKSNSNQ